MEEKKLTDEEIKKAFFILAKGSDEGLSEYVKAVLVIKNEYKRQKAEIERLKDRHLKLMDEHDEYGNLAVERLIENEELKAKAVELQKQVDELKEELEKVYEIERANIQSEIADAGTSCHWCKNETVKDTAKEILQAVLEDVGEFYVGDIVEQLSKRYGVEVE
jgi:chromosome segregation ATPase